MRTRFAPSPTGYLHIGGVRTALFNWLLARQSGGQFVLRVDDTDQQRNLDAALVPILGGFKWLGLDWDEGPVVGGPHGPYFQSQRSDLYRAAVEKLLTSGHAYRDFATAEEIAAEREAAKESGQSFTYSRKWAAESHKDARRFEAEGRQGVVRLKMPREGTCEFTDGVRGPMSFDWAAEQDHVMVRADGTFIYHLASVVDDAAMRITNVVRAEEHLSNTPRQIFIARALGYELPRYAHLPVVAEPGSKTKLSKRKIAKYMKMPEFKKLYEHGRSIMDRLGETIDDETFNPVIVDFYERTGYLPEALLNYLLLLGWSLDDETEDFSRDQMIARFSLDRVNKAPASFDPAKLMATQERKFAVRAVDEKRLRVTPFLQAVKLVEDPLGISEAAKLDKIITAAGDRLKVAGDILDYRYFFVTDDRIEYDEKALARRIESGVAKELLTAFSDVLEKMPESDFQAAKLEASLKTFLEDRGRKIGDLIHALRVAVTGQAVGFGLFETLEILGKNACLARIHRCS